MSAVWHGLGESYEDAEEDDGSFGRPTATQDEVRTLVFGQAGSNNT